MSVAACSNTIRWNIVNRGVNPGVTVHTSLTRKIARLAKHLMHFPPDALHLQVTLEKLSHDRGFNVRLTLRLPSNILHAEKSGPDLLAAIDGAANALEREVESVKAHLRGDYRWRRPAYRARLRRDALVFSEPMGPGRGPQDHADMIRELLQSHDRNLVAHVMREIRMAELTGDIPQNAVEARDIVDEVARVCLADTSRKPDALTYEQWFYQLIQEEMESQRRRYEEQRREDQRPKLHRDITSRGEDAGDDAERPLSIITRQIQPEEILPGEEIPDSWSLPPDVAASGREIIEGLQQVIQHWPPEERQVFELHFLVGFDVEEIAMMRGRAKAEIEATVAKIQSRLRQFMRMSAHSPA
jgi:ribosomal subunit interface protein